MNEKTLTLYLRNISCLEMLSASEELSLAKSIKDGDQEALTRLISANLRIVVKIAFDFKGIGIPIEDLIAAGNVGLIRAAGRFDVLKETRFYKYAAYWIRQAIRQYLIEDRPTIRIPAASRLKINKAKRARAALRVQLGRRPTTEEIAERLNTGPQRVTRLLCAPTAVVSIHDPISRESDHSLENTIRDRDTLDPFTDLNNREQNRMLKQHLQKLTDREQAVLSRRFGLHNTVAKSLKEVGREIGYSSERVRQIQVGALKKLRLLMLCD